MGITSDRFRDEQAEYFGRLGAAVVVGPCLETTRLPASASLREQTELAIRRPPDSLVVDTAMGLRNWMVAAEGWGLKASVLAALSRTRVYARGAKAKAEAESVGLTVYSAAEIRLRETVQGMVAGGVFGTRVAVLVDGSGRAPELGMLRSANAGVEAIATYLWKMPEDRRPALRLAEGVIAGRVHAVTFTARPALQNWLVIATEEGIDGPLRTALTGGGVTIGCMGPVCAEAAIEEGIASTWLVAPSASTLGSLAAGVGERLRNRVVRTSDSHGDDRISLSGMIATIDGESYSLTPAEARLLGALLRKPNTVVTQEELLRSVWEGTAQDPNLVEVMVARLRRRLGVHGAAITAVQRRGYALRY